jgi:tricorn protease
MRIGIFARALVSLAVAFMLVSTGRPADAAAPPLLLRDPSVSATQIAFSYGGDIWIVARGGGDAHRLVTGLDQAAGPIFSPDGTQVAFSANYDGNVDVYVVPAAGGEPRRLTSHPAPDIAVGWTRDGSRVLFRSNRASYSDPDQLYTVPVTGGFPTELPLTMAERGSYSPDGTHLAYVPNFRWEPFWQGYRGGQTTPIYLANLADSSIVKIPSSGSNDDDPMWVGDHVYFVSDRDGPSTLFSYDVGSHRVARLLPASGYDITSASAGAGVIVYAKFDSLHLYDPATQRDQTIHVSVAGDMPQLRPHWQHVGMQIVNGDISPSGARAVFEAHGEIFTVPAEHGDVRNVSNSSATAEREPAWSPDGRWIAYFSDASGAYQLVVRDQLGLQAPRTIVVGNASTYEYAPTWSPDSKKIAFVDSQMNLWYVELDHPTPVKVATALHDGFGPADFAPSWSPDSAWLAYTNGLPSFLHAVDVYSLATHSSHRVTDGMSDARNPVFDKNGSVLYFSASTNTGLTTEGLDMTSDQHPVSSNVYAVVLRRDVPSPVLPQSDDEHADGAATPSPSPSPAAKAGAAASKVTIDFAGISQRVITLPIDEGNYVQLAAGKTGQLFLLRAPLADVDPMPPALTLSRFDVSTRKTTPLAAAVSGFALSADGEKMLLNVHRTWYIAPSSQPFTSGTPLAVASLELQVDPRAEWAQMYREAWRMQRAFFYDPHDHGLDIDTAQKHFEPYLAGIASRDDLTFLFEEMLSYLSVGHMFVRGGTQPPTDHVTVGLLGADYTIDHDRYRFAKIYDGENWNPELRAPLTQPGTDVKTGEYLLAVNGRELYGSDEIYAFFQETAGKQTTITVGPNPTLAGSRQVTVVPVARENALRNLAWIEDNRRTVDRLSGGKLAYVYMPDTEYDGFTNFNRYFFSQIGKQGVVLDERFNHGGQIADYVIDVLSRKPMSIVVPRAGKPTLDPPLAIYGPKVMVINQFSGSGGDAMPWYFRKAGLGPLVGVRTWGGLVGIGGYPPLIDGGMVTAPRTAIGGLHGNWEVEGHGVTPDVEVMQDPKLVREGHDPQLEAAVAKALQLLREHPLPTYKPPAYPNHHPVLPGN